jgi:hypothetical protein
MLAAKAGISEVGSGFDPAPTHLHAIRKYGHIVTGAFSLVLAKHLKRTGVTGRVGHPIGPTSVQFNRWL